MTYSKKQLLRSSLVLLTASSLTLSACATKNDRRGPPKDRGDRSERLTKRTSGTFLQPIAIVFTSMDTNGDKIVSLAEVQTGINSEWSAFDRSPSAAYFAEWSLKNLGSTDAMPTFMSFDRDFSGVITQAEFSGQLESSFNRMDKNGDGRLERSEMLISFDAPRGERARQSGEKGGGKGGRGGGGGRGGEGRGSGR